MGVGVEVDGDKRGIGWWDRGDRVVVEKGMGRGEVVGWVDDLMGSGLWGGIEMRGGKVVRVRDRGGGVDKIKEIMG